METSSSSLVKLNVGGVKYATTMATLRAQGDNHLTQLVNEPHPATDSEGSIFIDRNGRIFEKVLDYLRTGRHFKLQKS
jgi:hypothetical protein